MPELQQPSVHGEPPHEQEPPEQVCPDPQAPHVAPLSPQAVGPWAACAMHCWVWGLQQPFWHAEGLHTHCPAVLQV